MNAIENWQHAVPQTFCAEAVHLDITLDRLGQKVSSIRCFSSLDPAQIKEKVVVLVLSTQVKLAADQASAQASHECAHGAAFHCALRRHLYRLCDSELRPYCKKTHRPFPIREKRAEDARRVSGSIVDAGTLFLSLTEMARDSAALNAMVQAILAADPALLVIVSDSSALVEAVYSSHAAHLPSEILPLIMLSNRMELSVSSSDDHVAHGKNLIRTLNQSLVGGRAMLQLGIQRELNAQRDYDVALAANIWVVEYLYLLGMWRNALNGREVSPLEHVSDHLDRLGPLGWKKDVTGVHLAFDLNVLSSQQQSGSAGSRPFGCTLQELGPVITYLGRTGLCKVSHLMADLGVGADLEKAAGLIAVLIHKFVLLREEYSDR